MGGNALTPSGVSHFFRGCCFDVDDLRRYLAAAGEVGLHCGKMLCQLGALADNGEISVTQSIVARRHQLVHMGQKQQAVDTLVLLVRVGEMAANVTLAERTEQGVDQRMSHNIGVGVTV